jgi:hypothetical protein
VHDLSKDLSKAQWGLFILGLVICFMITVLIFGGMKTYMDVKTTTVNGWEVTSKSYFPDGDGLYYANIDIEHNPDKTFPDDSTFGYFIVDWVTWNKLDVPVFPTFKLAED